MMIGIWINSKNRYTAKIALTDVTSDIRIKARENNSTILEEFRFAFVDCHVPDDRWDRTGLLPCYCLRVTFARRSRGSTQSMDHEIGMLREEKDEALSDGSCCSQDTDFNFFCFVGRHLDDERGDRNASGLTGRNAGEADLTFSTSSHKIGCTFSAVTLSQLDSF